MHLFILIIDYLYRVYQVFDESPNWDLRWKHVDVFKFSFLCDHIAYKSISLAMLCVNRTGMWSFGITACSWSHPVLKVSTN